MITSMSSARHEPSLGRTASLGATVAVTAACQAYLPRARRQQHVPEQCNTQAACFPEIHTLLPAMAPKLDCGSKSNCHDRHCRDLIYLCICLFICSYKYMHADLHTYILTYIHIDIHTYIHTYIHTHVHTHIYTYTVIHIHIHRHIHMHMHIYTYTHTHVHTQKRMNVYLVCMHGYHDMSFVYRYPHACPSGAASVFVSTHTFQEPAGKGSYTHRMGGHGFLQTLLSRTSSRFTSGSAILGLS